MIGKNITPGGSFDSGAPVIGSDVHIGPGVRILGDVTVGDNVVSGANAVVVKDIPSNCIAFGIPAHVHRSLAPGALDTLSGVIREDTEA